jgi:flagellar basal-body rod modification protein FlgD
MNNVDKPGVTSFESLGIAKPKEGPKKPQLGQEDFMKLMTTQLNNQDPFKPMENGDFLTQMAQFSAVSGLKDIKDNFKVLTDAMTSNQALQASTLVGRKVLVPGDSNVMPDKGVMQGAVELPASTSNLSIKVTDATGELIHTIDMGSQKEGLVNYKWDGMKKIIADDGSETQQRVAAGQYKIIAEIEVEGKPQAINALIVDKVDSVSLGKQGQGMTLNLANSGSSKLADIRQLM